MAGDWIKMRTDLYRDPKVCVIADLLINKDSDLSRYVSQNMQRDMCITRNVMRNVTVGALVSVWGVLRHRGKRIEDDLVIKGCTINVIDDVAEIQGFGQAMESVGWVECDDVGLVFPRFFEEFNVDPSADLRAKNAERQKRFREKQKAESNEKSNVTVTLKSNDREEKRREEKYIQPKSQKSSDFVLPDWLDVSLWNDFKKMRVKARKRMTERAEKMMLDKLKNFHSRGINTAKVLEKSILNSWTDVYEPDAREATKAEKPEWMRGMI